jgi:flagellar basal body-associated protein FliL
VSNQNDNDEAAQRNKREQRAMWIFSGVIVLIILGAMGANMMFHKEQPAGATDISSQSRTTDK